MCASKTAHRMLLLAVALLGASLAWPSSAHLLNMSKAQLTLQPGGVVSVDLALDLLVSVGARDAYFRYSTLQDPLSDAAVSALLAPLPDAVHLSLGGARIPLSLVSVRFPDAPERVFLDPLRWPRTDITLRGDLSALEQTPVDGGLLVRYDDSFRFEEPIANTIMDATSGLSQTRWLVTDQPSPAFDASAWYDNKIAAPVCASVDWAGLLDFGAEGFRHILPQGVDHLLFVAGLCLGARSLRALVGAISVFTLAHSITLCAMALGWVSLPSRFVEAMILLSIVWVALSNLKAELAPRGRYLIVLFFGLLHGLGFAGALADIGLPAQQALPSLLAFNIGVELGQLVFLAALLGMLALARHMLAGNAGPALIPAQTQIRQWASLLIAAAAAGILLYA